MYGSFLPIPNHGTFPGGDEDLKNEELPGAIILKKDSPIPLNVGRQRTKVKVTNTGDRPIQVGTLVNLVRFPRVLINAALGQVGSHYHFTEVNKALKFDRSLSFFKRLDIAAGTAVRFEPGDTKTVTLVDIAGKKIVTGGNLLVNTSASKLATTAQKDEVLRRIVERGFGHEKQAVVLPSKEIEPEVISRESYASMYGPTTGDRVRLADTELWIEIEDDKTVYGDECKFGGGESSVWAGA